MRRELGLVMGATGTAVDLDGSFSLGRVLAGSLANDRWLAGLLLDLRVLGFH